MRTKLSLAVALTVALIPAASACDVGELAVQYAGIWKSSVTWSACDPNHYTDTDDCNGTMQVSHSDRVQVLLRNVRDNNLYEMKQFYKNFAVRYTKDSAIRKQLDACWDFSFYRQAALHTVGCYPSGKGDVPHLPYGGPASAEGQSVGVTTCLRPGEY